MAKINFLSTRMGINYATGTIAPIPVESSNSVLVATNDESYLQRLSCDALTCLMFCLIEF